MQSLIEELEKQENFDLTQQLEFSQQTQEVLYYRLLEVENYKTGYVTPFYWEIPFDFYYQYRSEPDAHAGAYINSQESIEYFQASLSTWKDLVNLADLLMELADNDEEVYANMVLQVTHQFKYEATENTKYPIESFVEGSGDCDTLAVFAAALMKAGGLDSNILLGTAKGSPEDELGIVHAMVGVNLSQQPDDHNRPDSWYYDYDGNTYYLGEATWSDVFLDPADYSQYGSAIGDMPWSEFLINDVVQT